MRSDAGNVDEYLAELPDDRRRLAGASLPNQAELRAQLVAWLHRAHAAGLTPEDVTALVETTMRATVAVEAPRKEPQ